MKWRLQSIAGTWIGISGWVALTPPSGSTAPGPALTTLTRVKRDGGFGDTQDELLQDLIYGISEAMQNYMDRTIASTDYTDVLDGVSFETLVLRQAQPVRPATRSRHRSPVGGPLPRTTAVPQHIPRRRPCAL